MIKVRMRDLALVAVAGGLLAFELVSIGEAFPVVKKALAARGPSGKAIVASAGAASAPAIETSASPVSRAVVGAAGDHAHRLAAATSPAKAKCCVTVTRARSAQRPRGRVRVVTLKTEGSFAYTMRVPSTVDMKDVQKAVDLALKQATL